VDAGSEMPSKCLSVDKSKITKKERQIEKQKTSRCVLEKAINWINVFRKSSVIFTKP